MFSKRTLEGELIIDHRAGDGTAQCPAGTRLELPTVSCAHCQRIVLMNPLRTRERAWCMQCDRYICDQCNAVRHAAGYVHESFAEFADRYIKSKEVLNG
jgi:hypothetical protein